MSLTDDQKVVALARLGIPSTSRAGTLIVADDVTVPDDGDLEAAYTEWEQEQANLAAAQSLADQVADLRARLDRAADGADTEAVPRADLRGNGGT